MEKVLAAIDEIHGGAGTWLRANGWTDRDAASLRHKLLDVQPEHANLWDVDDGVMAARN